jgi:hypothetical protein
MNDWEYAVHLINLGTDFHHRFFNNAQRCWAAACELLDRLVTRRRQQLWQTFSAQNQKSVAGTGSRAAASSGHQQQEAWTRFQNQDEELQRLINALQVGRENRMALAKDASKPFGYKPEQLKQQLLRIYGEPLRNWTLRL